MAPATLVPSLFKRTRKKSLTVKDAIAGDYWLQKLPPINNEEDLLQFLFIWDKIQRITLTELPDKITWIHSNCGKYSAKSAYHIQFTGRIRMPDLDRVWKTKIEGRVRFFI